MSEPRWRKADTIVRAIETKFLNGDFRPGNRLNERKLAETLNVSRTQIHEALLRLVSSGLISESGRGGVVVSHPTVSALLDAYLWCPNWKAWPPANLPGAFCRIKKQCCAARMNATGPPRPPAMLSVSTPPTCCCTTRSSTTPTTCCWARN